MIHGNLDPWSDTFPDALVGQVIELLVDAWADMPPFVGWPLEDTITRAFVSRIRRSKRGRKLPFSIHGQYELLDPVTGDITGRIDLCAVHGHCEEVYLAFECKRLNVPGAARLSYPRASEYVLQGMTRFVDGQYGGRIGGMVGYVLDRNVPAAMAAVERSVRQHADPLAVQVEDPAMRPSTCSALPTVRQTVHAPARGALVLHHVFLAWP